MRFSILLVAGLLTFYGNCFSMERFDVVSTEEIKQLLKNRTEGKIDFLLVNGLDEIIFRDSAIPGSINVPWPRVEEIGADRLGDDKNRLIITYWMGYRWVFAYNTAVAVKKLGYTNIKIYNGGLKDWKKAGNPVEVIEPLPEYEGNFISAEELFARIQEADTKGCGTPDKPVLSILDLRTESSLRTNDNPVPVIKTSCPVQPVLFDSLRNEDVREKIPKQGLVVVVCETGNRGTMIMRYLSKFGFTNIEVLKFGMRGWIKSGYPIIKNDH